MPAAKKKRKKGREAPALIRHLKEIGYTNRLADALVLLLFVGLAGGFILAVLSIKYKYEGALVCWTVVFTPIGTALSIVLARIVEKSRAENTGANGEGIKYAAAMAELIGDAMDPPTGQEPDPGSDNSPKI